MRRHAPFEPINPDICMWGGVHDVINCAKFFENRPKGFGASIPRNLAFPIDFAGRPYNTLTLPCEVWYIFFIYLFENLEEASTVPRTLALTGITVHTKSVYICVRMITENDICILSASAKNVDIHKYLSICSPLITTGHCLSLLTLQSTSLMKQ